VRILFIALRLPHPPYRGDCLHIAEILRSLATRHDVTLMTLASGHEPTSALEAVRSICRTTTVRHSSRVAWLRAIAGLATAKPSQVLYCRSRRMHEAIARELSLGGFDVVVAHTIRMAQFAEPLREARRILMLGDAMGHLLGQRAQFEKWWVKPALRWERLRVDRYTADVRPRFDEAWVFSPIDQAYEHEHGCPDVRVVRHGVSEHLFDIRRVPGRDPLVLFVGNLSVPHNIDAARFAARQVFPLLKERVPHAELVIAGADPGPAVIELQDQPGVIVPGTVPDLRPLWSRANVCIAPLRYSAGIQNKVLEAAAAGVPVVTTPPAAAAVGFEADVHALVAEDAAGLAAALADTIENPGPAAERAGRARDLVRRLFRWDAVLDAIG
jgi:glycosyltransferase involved in cell wall biosynthesis